MRSRSKGDSRAWDPKIILSCLQQVASGVPIREVGRRQDVPAPTVQYWTVERVPADFLRYARSKSLDLPRLFLRVQTALRSRGVSRT